LTEILGRFPDSAELDYKADERLTSETTMPTPDAPTAAAPSGRMTSIDALRGFDMLWIVGGGAIAEALERMRPTRVTMTLAEQFRHVRWEGLRFYDLIFPLFLFLVGVSLVYSLDKTIAAEGLRSAIVRILKRSVLLFVLGVFYSGGLRDPWPQVALAGVLQRIAVCYLLASLAYCAVRRPIGLAAIAAVLLVGYWLLLVNVPFPDLKLDKQTVQPIARDIENDSPAAIAATVEPRIRGTLEEGRNLTNYVDFRWLPGWKTQTYYINEGLLSTLPCLALPLLGAVAGLLLKNPRVTPGRKTALLIAMGLAAIAIGLGWSTTFPIIKRIWTSSFVLVAAGFSFLMLSLFYYVIDVRGRQSWCRPFVWLGANAITIYLTARIVNFTQVAERLVGGDIEHFLDEYVTPGFGGLVVAVVGLLLATALAQFLYVRRIFIRV
jgi:predicted acyltransferase